MSVLPASGNIYPQTRVKNYAGSGRIVKTRILGSACNSGIAILPGMPGPADSVLETAYTALKSVLGVRPQPFDHTGIVVAVRQVVVQGGKTVALAS
jgi:hypothetical protein